MRRVSHQANQIILHNICPDHKVVRVLFLGLDLFLDLDFMELLLAWWASCSSLSLTGPLCDVKRRIVANATLVAVLKSTLNKKYFKKLS